jgi:tRNA (guanine37-N1)-methyltransferase
VVVEAVARLLPGALGDEEGARDDSHEGGLLEYPHYTRPPEFRGWGVPDVLLSGNHAQVRRWRREQALRRTFLRRPDLLARAPLSDEEQRLIREWERREEKSRNDESSLAHPDGSC